MKQQDAIREARKASLATSRQMWVWSEGDNFHFDVAIPKGRRLFCRVIGEELWRWDGGVLVSERVFNE